MQTRGTEWFDTKRMQPVYGIKVKHNGEWVNAAEDDGLLLFDTEEERDAKRRELAKQTIPSAS